MQRHSNKPSELTLQAKNGSDTHPTSRENVNLEGVDLASLGGGFEHDIAAGLTPLPTKQSSRIQSPPTSPRQLLSGSRENSKSFLSSFKNRPAQSSQGEKNTRQGKDKEDEYRPNTSSVSKIYHLRNDPGSTAQLSLVGSNENMRRESTDGEKTTVPDRRPSAHQQPSDENNGTKRKDKSFRIGITRSKSTRRDSHSKARPSGKDSFDASPTTAPLQSDWPGSESRMIGKGKEKDRRGKSAERATPAPTDSDENLSGSYPKHGKESKGGFKSGSKNVMSKAKSGGGSFLNRLGKIGRSSSNHERDVPDNEYQLKIINLPLVEQTRITRISKQLSGCRDKTEYWMPSLPWRCIDFLNTNAEEEGLYRIPGSGPKVKHWQRRFDSELDIDLLSEEVTDTNEIASMLKAWLRELPSEMMPASLQKSLAVQLEKENPLYKNVGQPASQLLRDALSDLPPYNYYLLFAITCHLSLLLTNKDVNKMDLNNLAVCVGPCLNLERWLFNYLVGDWRHCWQGCYTEKDYLKIEEMVEAGIEPPPASHEQYKIPEGDFDDDKSLTQSMWAASLGDDNKSTTNHSEWNTTIGDSTENVSRAESRAFSNGSGSAQSNHHDDARSMVSGDALGSRKNNENYQPMTYKPAGAKTQGNGSINSSSAEQRRALDDGVVGSTSNENTPKLGHARSRSDLPPTPIKTGNGHDGDVGNNYFGR